MPAGLLLLEGTMSQKTSHQRVTKQSGMAWRSSSSRSGGTKAQNW